MTKKSTGKNFDFKRGEKLEVFDRYVRVYNKDLGERIYSLNGKLLGKFSIKEIKISKKRFNDYLYMPLSGCILMKEGKFWNIFSYEGEKICDKPIYRVDFSKSENGYVFLYYNEKNTGEQSAVFSITGEFMIPFGKYKFQAYEKFIIVECSNGKFKLFDIQLKSFIKGEFEEIKPFFKNAILKTPEEYMWYNTETKKIEIKFDAYLYLQNYKHAMYFYEMYYKGNCGIYVLSHLKDSKRRERSFFGLVVPIEFQKIEFTNQGINAKKDGIIEFYSYDSLMDLVLTQEVEANDEQISEDVELKNKTVVKLFDKIEIKSGEIAVFGNKFIAIRFEKVSDYRWLYKYFSLNGIYIGESDDVYDEDRYYEHLSYIETKLWIALSKTTTFGFGSYSGTWTLYSYDGKKIFPVEFRELNKQTHYYIASQYTAFDEKCKDNFIAVCTMTGRILFTLKGNYKKLTVFDSNCFIAEDLENKFWFYDSDGKLIFDKGLDKRRITTLGDTFWIEDEEGYKIYDVITRRVYHVNLYEPEKLHVSPTNFYKVYIKGKCGIFTYTKQREGNFKIVGLKEVVPTIYEKVDLCGEFFRALKEESEDVYDLSGNLITTTKK